MLRGKQALPRQLFLQLLKGHVKVPRPLRGQAAAIELILPIPGKDGHPPGGDDLHPVLGAEAQGDGVPPEHDAPQGAFSVLQGEIVVAGGVHLIVGDLPPHQQTGQHPVPVHEIFQIEPHLARGEDGPCLLYTSDAADD